MGGGGGGQKSRGSGQYSAKLLTLTSIKVELHASIRSLSTNLQPDLKYNFLIQPVSWSNSIGSFINL